MANVMVLQPEKKWSYSPPALWGAKIFSDLKLDSPLITLWY